MKIRLLFSLLMLISLNVISQNYLTPVTNSFGLTATGNGRSSTSLGDIDNDGDLDLISGSTSNGIYYYENTGNATSPSFNTSVINPFNLTTPSSGSFYTPVFVDLDADGDLDIVSGNNFGQFFYYENTGTVSAPNYTDQIQGAFGMVESSFILSSPSFGDVDGDGDLDMFAGVFNESNGNFYYFENTGTTTAPAFDMPVQDPFNLTWSFMNPSSGFTFPFLIDFDADGDLDLFSGSSTNGNYFYYENTGTNTAANYATPLENPFNLIGSGTLSFPWLSDIDGDGDLDLLAGINSSSFFYHENGPAPATTLIPDSNFEEYLIYRGWDDIVDGQVLTANIETQTLINLDDPSFAQQEMVADITGIEDFISLTTLELTNNPITSIDISNNLALTTLRTKGTLLTTFDVSNNVNLIVIDGGETDLVSTTPSLNSIDVSNNINLLQLNLRNTNITNIDVSNNPALTRLEVSDSQLLEIDVSNNINLQQLLLSENSLIEVDLTSNINLTELRLASNQLEIIDIVQNPTITLLQLQNNNLSIAFLANDNNTALMGANFDITNNPSLTCVNVDSVTYSEANWPNIDSTATYSEDCLDLWIVYTTDTNFEAAIVESGADTNGDGEITYQEAQDFTDNIVLDNMGITDVTGLEAFTNANIVDISDNLIEDINSYLLSDSFIIELEFPSGRIQHLVRRPKIRIKSLNVARNNLTEVDISRTEGMEFLDVSGNNLTSLTLGEGTSVTSRDASTLIDMIATDNSNLGCIQVDNISDGNRPGWLTDPGVIYSTNCSASLSTDDINLEDAIVLSPNPTTSVVTVNLRSGLQLNNITVYGLDGKQLVSTTQQTIDLASFTKGIYLLNIITDLGSVSKRIIKN